MMEITPERFRQRGRLLHAYRKANRRHRVTLGELRRFLADLGDEVTERRQWDADDAGDLARVVGRLEKLLTRQGFQGEGSEPHSLVYAKQLGTLPLDAANRQVACGWCGHANESTVESDEWISRCDGCRRWIGGATGAVPLHAQDGELIGVGHLWDAGRLLQTDPGHTRLWLWLDAAVDGEPLPEPEDRRRQAFEDGYRMGYGNGHYDGANSEGFDDDPADAFELASGLANDIPFGEPVDRAARDHDTDTDTDTVTDTNRTGEILAAVRKEREAQHAKWGVQDHPRRRVSRVVAVAVGASVLLSLLAYLGGIDTLASHATVGWLVAWGLGRGPS